MSSKRNLATKLAVVAGFEDPVASLEQYPTPPELAAHVIHVADLQGDIENRTVLDLGTGTGMLALGATLRSPACVVGIEIDAPALSIAQRNERRVGSTAPVHWIRGDAGRSPIRGSGPTTVVMNPPFGAQDGHRHSDRRFLETAAELAEVSYSIHNEGSQEFLEAFASDNGGTITHAFKAEFELEHQFDHHTKDRREVDTEVYRIKWAPDQDA